MDNQIVYTQKSVALSDVERHIVGALATRLGLSFSSALRIVIREWAADQPPLAYGTPHDKTD